jgi:hypothetical protein
VFRTGPGRTGPAELGADRHIWETRLAALEEDLQSEPVESLGELLDLSGEVFPAAGLAESGGDADASEVEAICARARGLFAARERDEAVRHDDAQQAAAELRTILRWAFANPHVEGGLDLGDGGSSPPR